MPGDWWSATTHSLIGYESWLERDHVMLLDFDRTVNGIASQPFWLFWTTQDGKTRSHAPDYFARRRDGAGVVVDCVDAPADDKRPIRRLHLAARPGPASPSLRREAARSTARLPSVWSSASWSVSAKRVESSGSTSTPAPGAYRATSNTSPTDTPRSRRSTPTSSQRSNQRGRCRQQ
ncbi:TnsA-like heteromeric transposase endonuclease subunit [Nonomuraea africana]|uniref:TnsA-like heteromeric transposase endonuclease subunit n=1 Tax=Nonomuraea africana TaxID=46171 RepID=UPI0033D06EA3